MQNILLQNIVHIDKDVKTHNLFYDALQQVSSTSNYWTFTDAKDAFKTLVSKKITPDIIFMDLDFSKMSGNEFLARIKKYEHLRNIPVIIISNSSKRSTIQITRILGAKGFVPKPDNQRELISILFSILSVEFLMRPQPMLSSFASLQKNQIAESISEDFFWSGVTQYGFYLN
jgi:CheY-like chemotaxis protein